MSEHGKSGHEDDNILALAALLAIAALIFAIGAGTIS